MLVKHIPTIRMVRITLDLLPRWSDRRASRNATFSSFFPMGISRCRCFAGRYHTGIRGTPGSQGQ